MPLIELGMPTVEIGEARTNLADIVADLEANPARAYALVHEEATAAVILHPRLFDLVVAAVQDVVDIQDAEEALASEPLTSFADYHVQRLAHRRAAQS